MTIVKIDRGRGRPRAFDRGTALARAMEVFWANGYEGTSMPMLTEAMGISAQSLYAAFGSKEVLYRDAIELYRTTIGGFGARALGEEADALEAVEKLLRDAADVFARTEGAPGCMITTAPGGLGDAPLAMFGRELRADAVARVAERIARGQREGQVREDADSDAWARFVASIVQGMSVQARDGVSAQTLGVTAALAAQALRAIRPPGWPN
jgi:AcrR family transcriptional regulator